MRTSIDGWLASLHVDTSVSGEDDLTDIHDDLEVFTEHGQAYLTCNKCQNMWSINFSNSEDLGDHFSLESLTNLDPLLCMKSYLVDYLDYNENLYPDGPETVSVSIQASNEDEAIAQVKEELDKAETKYEILKVEEE